MAEETKVKFADKNYDEDAASVEIVFGDGATLTLAKSDLNDSIWLRAALHGLLQKIGDSYAGAKGDYKAAKKAASDVIEALKAGTWNAGRGEGEGKPRVLELAVAISRLKGIAVADAETKLRTLDEAAVKSLRNIPEIKAEIASIRAEKAREALAKAGSTGFTFG
jgi:hypothetical protein